MTQSVVVTGRAQLGALTTPHNRSLHCRIPQSSPHPAQGENRVPASRPWSTYRLSINIFPGPWMLVSRAELMEHGTTRNIISCGFDQRFCHVLMKLMLE